MPSAPVGLNSMSNPDPRPKTAEYLLTAFDQELARQAIRNKVLTPGNYKLGAEELTRQRRNGKQIDLASILVSLGFCDRQELLKIHQSLKGRTGDFPGISGYRIHRKLGEGAMGSVFLAEQIASGQNIALKVLSPELIGDREYYERFMREVEALKALHHPNIVAGIDAGSSGGHTYYAMEYVNGPSLQKWIEVRKKLPIDYVLKICLQVSRGLAHARHTDIIHRDIKPENILIKVPVDQQGIAVPPGGDEDVFKITDLGLVKRTGASADASLTQAGFAVGTPHYMSPEQARGEEVDFRTDIYGLGCSAYHAIAGRPPFNDESPVRVMAQQVNTEAPDIRQFTPEVPSDVVAILRKMLAKDRKDRYLSYKSLVDDLTAVMEKKAPPNIVRTARQKPLKGKTPKVAVDGVSGRSRRLQRAKKGGVVGPLIGLAAVLAVLGGVVFAAWKMGLIEKLLHK
ncbi:MAG: serine/threonine protein kinase [Planctomycetota bacterium]